MMLDSPHTRRRGYCRRALRKENKALTNLAGAAGKPTASGAGHDSPDDEQTSRALLALTLSSLDDDKADDVVSIDLRGRSEIADYMVIASGRSSRQVSAISDNLAERIKQRLGRGVRIEGKDQGDWVLIDAGDVIVHVFRPEVRAFYQLEKMWLPTGAAPGAKA